MKLQTSLFSFRPVQLFIILSAGFAALNFYTYQYIFTDSFYLSTLGEKVGYHRAYEIMQSNRRFEWLTYFLVPLSVLIRVSLVAGILYLGVFLSNRSATFRSIFKIALLAEILPLIALTIKLAVLTFFPSENASEMQTFYPLSLIQVFSAGEIPSYLVYPVQLVNLFEAAYWLVLAFGLQTVLKNSFRSSLGMVAATYGTALFIWTATIVFIQVSFGS